MVHTLMVLYEQPHDPLGFRDYYLSTHLLKARLLPGAKTIRCSADVSALGADSPFIAIFEADFDSAEDMVAALQSPAGQDAQADVGNFASGAVHILHFASDG